MIEGKKNLRKGMQVYGPDNQMIGTIESLEGDGVMVKGRHIRDDDIERVEGDRAYLRGSWSGASQSGAGMAARGGTVSPENEVRVPVREERLHVDKRQTELGEVQVRKEVVEERQTVPVELTREEVHIDQHDVKERPATEGDMADAFKETTIRVPVRGEEAVATKEAVVTGEVVIDKERTTQRQEVSDTVRKERVEVDENYDRARSAYQQSYASRGQQSKRSFDQAEPHFRQGYSYGTNEQYRGKEWDEVEPELRRRYESSGGDPWEELKEDVREGFRHARGR